MDKATFDQCVEMVSNILTEFRDEWGQTVADAMVNFYVDSEEAKRKEILQDLIRCSGQFKPAWDALGLIARDLRRTGTPFPDELADWLVELEVLGGTRQQPKARSFI